MTTSSATSAKPQQATAKKLKFQSPPENILRKNINDLVVEYFRANNTSRYANAEMKWKIAIWLGTWFISYVLLITLDMPVAVIFLVGIYHMFTHLMIAFNIAHDANHNAVFENKKLNRLLSYSLDIIGVNSKMWRVNHNIQHHSFVNVQGEDDSIAGYGLFRFTPKEKHLKHHKYQHLYFLFIYAVSTINYVFVKDFKIWKFCMDRRLQNVGYKDLALIILQKACYIGYMIIIPIFVAGIPAWVVLTYYTIGQLFVGMLLALIFQLGHLIEGTNYPDVNDGVVQDEWNRHIIHATCDFAKGSYLFQWFFGGINIHVIHHLCPNICHVHYRKLSYVLNDKVAEMGMNYHEFKTFGDAFRSHVRVLKKLGNDPRLR